MRYFSLIVIGVLSLFGLLLWLTLDVLEAMAGNNLGRLIYLLVLLSILALWWGSSRLSGEAAKRDLKYLLIWGVILMGVVGALYLIETA